MIMKLKLAIILNIFFIISAYSQKQVIHQSLYWIRYYHQLQLNSKFSLHAEIENRRFIKNNIQHHLINHYRLHYKLSPSADIAGGITFSWQSPQIPDGIHHLIIPEIRSVQEFNLSQNITKKFALSHRYRIDERFIHKDNGQSLENGYNFNFRFRYRLQMSYKVNRIFKFKTGDEIMINYGSKIIKNAFDQNRIFFSLESEISKNIALELNYFRWYQQRPSGTDYFSRDIYRFTFLHKVAIHIKSK